MVGKRRTEIRHIKELYKYFKKLLSEATNAFLFDCFRRQYNYFDVDCKLLRKLSKYVL